MSQLTLEQLIEIAKANLGNTDIALDLDEVAKFIILFKLKEGKNKVSGQIVFEAYQSWCIRPMKKLAFLRQFAKHFEPVKSSGLKYYFLNTTTTQLLNILEKHNEKQQTK